MVYEPATADGGHDLRLGLEPPQVAIEGVCPAFAPEIVCGNADDRFLTRLRRVATFSLMRAVGIKVLNSRLSEYVRLAGAGETILVTDRGRVVAEIGPPRETRSPVLADAMLADAVRKGRLSPPGLAPNGIPPARLPVMPLQELLSGLADDRRDR